MRSYPNDCLRAFIYRLRQFSSNQTVLMSVLTAGEMGYLLLLLHGYLRAFSQPGSIAVLFYQPHTYLPFASSHTSLHI